jgi:hypothetical protein
MTGETHARARSPATVAEHHALHRHRGAEGRVDLVQDTPMPRTLAMPAGQDRASRLPQLHQRILGKRPAGEVLDRAAAQRRDIECRRALAGSPRTEEASVGLSKRAAANSRSRSATGASGASAWPWAACRTVKPSLSRSLAPNAACTRTGPSKAAAPSTATASAFSIGHRRLWLTADHSAAAACRTRDSPPGEVNRIPPPDSGYP